MKVTTFAVFLVISLCGVGPHASDVAYADGVLSSEAVPANGLSQIPLTGAASLFPRTLLEAATSAQPQSLILVAAGAGPQETEVAPPPVKAEEPPVKAEEPPVAPKVAEVPSFISTIVLAIKDRNWTMATSAFIMLLVFLLNFFWLKNLSGKRRKVVLPWSAVVIGFTMQFASVLASTGSWLDALNGAFITGTAAGGLWSLVGRAVSQTMVKPASIVKDPVDEKDPK